MGLLESLASLAGSSGDAAQHTNIAQALVQTAGEQPGGLAGLLNGFRQNGMDQHVNSWTSTGPNQSISPDQVQQGMGGEMLAQVAQRAGVSPQIASIALATVLPMVVSHFSQNGQLPSQGGLAGLASQIFGNRG